MYPHYDHINTLIYLLTYLLTYGITYTHIGLHSTGASIPRSTRSLQ